MRNHAGSSGYGYLRDEKDGDHWIVDEEAAEVVRKIFRLTMEGKGPFQIARILENDKIEIPSAHMARFGQGQNKNKPVSDPFHWNYATVSQILRKQEYLGHTVNFKTTKHFKDKRSHYVSEDNWVVFENTQEPIIDEETFENVQRIRRNVKRYPDGFGEVHALTGLLYCADCGSKLYVHRMYNGKPIPYYTCSAYGKVPTATLCPTRHMVMEADVLELIRELLKEIAAQAGIDREEFLQAVREMQEQQDTKDITKQKQKLDVDRRREKELELLLCRIYEDNVLGKLPDERYQMLCSLYEDEKRCVHNRS